MITHIVLLKISENDDKLKIIQLIKKLAELQNTSIPQIKNFGFGENNSPEGLNRGYTHCFTMQFLNTSDRDIYLLHKDHTDIATELCKLLENGINSFLVIDY